MLMAGWALSSHAQTARVDAVTLHGGTWGYTWYRTVELEKSGDNTWTGSIKRDEFPEFTLGVTGTNEADGDASEVWLGDHFTVVDPDGVVNLNSDHHSLDLNYMWEYADYQVTATWEPGSDFVEGWTLTFALGNPYIAPIDAVDFVVDTGKASTNIYLNETEEGSNTYTAVADLMPEDGMTITSDVWVSLHIKSIPSEDWLGPENTDRATYVAPEGWLDGNLLKHSITGYSSYVITATWEPNLYFNKNWTVTIEGKDIATSISQPQAPAAAGQHFTIDGRKAAQGQRGLQIVKQADGRVVKTFVR